MISEDLEMQKYCCSPQQTLIPALDDLSCAKSEGEGLIPRYTAVKFCPVLQFPLHIKKKTVKIRHFWG